MFDLNGKVALISGGASGIGFSCAKQLLRNNLKGVAIADISSEEELNVLQEIENEFGSNRAIFIKTDVSSREQFENAFKKTIETFKNIDILINNAGVMNDSIWEREISINLNGTVNGCLLALENYITKYMIGDEGVVLNISSISALRDSAVYPIYSATKHAIVGLTRSLGLEVQYKHSKVRFLAICPGGTDTVLMKDCHQRTLGPFYQSMVEDVLPFLPKQSPENVALAVVHIITKGNNGSVWGVERNEPPYEVVLPPLDRLKK